MDLNDVSGGFGRLLALARPHRQFQLDMMNAAEAATQSAFEGSGCVFGGKIVRSGDDEKYSENGKGFIEETEWGGGG